MTDSHKGQSNSDKCPSVSGIQHQLAEITADLRRIDHRLETLVQDLPELDEDFHILKELRAAADCVRGDLLQDAIETLDNAATLSPIELRRRFEERKQWRVTAA